MFFTEADRYSKLVILAVASRIRQRRGAGRSRSICRDQARGQSIQKGQLTIVAVALKTRAPRVNSLFLSSCTRLLYFLGDAPRTFLLGTPFLLSTSREIDNMWPSLSLSALWLAACAVAAGSDTGSTNEEGIRSIPVPLLSWLWRGDSC
jgi:hypothetical protein